MLHCFYRTRIHAFFYFILIQFYYSFKSIKRKWKWHLNFLLNCLISYTWNQTELNPSSTLFHLFTIHSETKFEILQNYDLVNAFVIKNDSRNLIKYRSCSENVIRELHAIWVSLLQITNLFHFSISSVLFKFTISRFLIKLFFSDAFHLLYNYSVYVFFTKWHAWKIYGKSFRDANFFTDPFIWFT